MSESHLYSMDKGYHFSEAFILCVIIVMQLEQFYTEVMSNFGKIILFKYWIKINSTNKLKVFIIKTS